MVLGLVEVHFLGGSLPSCISMETSPDFLSYSGVIFWCFLIFPGVVPGVVGTFSCRILKFFFGTGFELEYFSILFSVFVEGPG